MPFQVRANVTGLASIIHVSDLTSHAVPYQEAVVLNGHQQSILRSSLRVRELIDTTREELGQSRVVVDTKRVPKIPEPCAT